MKWFNPVRFLLLSVTISACQSQKNSEKQLVMPRLNEIQMIGSHNSYKQAIEPALLDLLKSEDSSLAASLDYAHISLQDQLEMGLRKLELDVFHDPDGNKFASPLGLQLLEKNGITPQNYDSLGKMKAGGFKVMHVQDIDYRSSCLILQDCLNELKTWSDQNPQHLPIAVSFNAKSDLINKPGFTKPLEFSSFSFDSLDAAILSVIPATRIITPGQVRENFPTLEEAVLAGNWPKLSNARGKFIFILDEKGRKLEEYIAGRPSLNGRVMFVNASPGNPEAAFLIVNDPIALQDSIQQLVKAGYLVRTRADANTLEARTGDYSRYEAALASGAQFISTDYYLPDRRFGTGYQVTLPGNKIARCNPVNAPDHCSDFNVE